MFKKILFVLGLFVIFAFSFQNIYDSKFGDSELSVIEETNQYRLLQDTGGVKYLEIILKDESERLGKGFFSTESGQIVLLDGSNEELTYIMTVRAEKTARENLLKK